MTEYRGMQISDNWPHKFAPNGKEVQIGEEPLMSTSEDHGTTMRPIYAQPMICVHCHKEWMRGKDPQPQENCPARNTKQEIKRITGA